MKVLSLNIFLSLKESMRLVLRLSGNLDKTWEAPRSLSLVDVLNTLNLTRRQFFSLVFKMHLVLGNILPTFCKFLLDPVLRRQVLKRRKFPNVEGNPPNELTLVYDTLFAGFKNKQI